MEQIAVSASTDVFHGISRPGHGVNASRDREKNVTTESHFDPGHTERD